MRSSVSKLASVALAASSTVSGIELDVNSTSSVYDAAQMIASNVMARYQNSSAAPGLFGQPYYFWESGLAWDAMINYGSATGDSQWNAMVAENILAQKGPDNDFMPPNQTKTLGNDDQARWALAAMTAAERGLPLPVDALDAGVGNWSELAINVWNSQVARWDDSLCGGGLRWQIFSFNNGYNYKNSFSNGEFVQLGTRLARYTGNNTYIDWALDAAQWAVDVGLLDQEGRVFDGTSTNDNCSQLNHIQWTANAGAYLSGTAYAANYSGPLRWSGYNSVLFLTSNVTFFDDGVMYEVACEPNMNCNTDQLAFKAVLARAMANTKNLAATGEVTQGEGCLFNQTGPCTTIGSAREVIQGWLESTAKAAAASCEMQDSGLMCGTNWRQDGYDGHSGLGQDLSALEAILAVLSHYEYQTTLPVNSAGMPGGYKPPTYSDTPGNSSSSSSGSGTSPSSSASPSSPASYDNAAGTSSASLFALVAAAGVMVAFST
ncbi:mannan endo-1,6-alpha-mannosidase [Hortaea werneckii]|uniref:Mannan endo-1,6-alpha-mannosidase n=1 Tax=Hortaea werneckii TaxID=91943 RepID=A0A3M7HJH1_HORWE|nr:mannan endo-1,6-alpha-mannosidase [Hortaea werneckii]KAI7571917.1 mannan endo-1,6-alpha-mannosidase [Hortaea werneckii]KAI7624709.1 mannan endo-1,6-alpha-mannosidase [Hortaea werneckii]KAI7632161.1 mannan endo-1,6-alpha-mannosidase [Hortaea werneckii]KAI7647426.1 mannan endo-1,6-alpha-mannosidase [Hortaea werneckii]